MDIRELADSFTQSFREIEERRAYSMALVKLPNMKGLEVIDTDIVMLATKENFAKLLDLALWTDPRYTIGLVLMDDEAREISTVRLKKGNKI